MAKIMIIEDDEMLRNQVAEILQAEGHEVVIITDFNLATQTFLKCIPDLVLLDINLPKFDGNYYCRVFRKYKNTPIIITSARNSDSDQILSMELGADEYVIKPFNIQVLLAKINALLRRTMGTYYAKEEKYSLRYKEIELEDNTFKVKYKGREYELSKNEYKLLKKLLSNPDMVVTREDLLQELWDDVSFVDDNTLTVNVTRVKKILKDMGLNDVIKTKRGVGYYISI